MNIMSTTQKLGSIVLLFFTFSAVSIARPPAELFPELPQTVKHGSYGVAAHVANIDMNGPSHGRALLNLKLPDGRSIQLKRTSFENRGSGNGLWQGRVSDYADSQAILTINKGRLVGRISIDGEVFEIRPYRGQQYIVEQLDLTAFPECDSGWYDNSQTDIVSGPIAEGVATASEGGTITIDLLSVYTPNARSNAGGTTAIETLIQAAVDNANISFVNSNMNARYRLVHMAEIDQPAQATTGDALSVVRNDANVAALRDQYGADMVSFIVDTPNSCGTGYVQRTPGASFESNAFQATDIDCAVGNLTFAHEHGHNMGMEHNPENSSVGSNPDSASYLWSFAHYVNGSYRTLMSYSAPCSNGCSRVTQFSNPTVNYAGEPTGIAGERDNARTGDLTAPIIENFRNAVAPQDGVINVRVSQSVDDVEERTSNGSMYLNSSDLEFGYDTTVASEQTIGLRFMNVTLPQGATITNAYLEFTVDETGSSTTNAEIRAESSNNAAGFTASNSDLTNRTTTNSVVTWSIPAWNTVGDFHKSPDITSLVQEVVDRGGWNTGGNMVFVIDSIGDRTAEAYDGVASSAPLLHVEYNTNTTPNEIPVSAFSSTTSDLTADFTDNSTDGDGSIASWSWNFGDNNSSTTQDPSHTYAAAGTYNVTLTVTDNDGESATVTQVVTVSAAPTNQGGVLNVRIAQSVDDVEERTSNGSMYLNSSDLEFGYDTTVASEQTIGLRFMNVTLPQGATITNAYLEFTVDETGSSTTNAEIRAESSNNAAGFTASNSDLTNRTTTNSVVTWSIPAWNTVGDFHKSPDITSLVQEVVDRGGWNTGGNMVFVIDSIGDRTAEAYDGVASSAPLLHVEYNTNTTSNER